MVQGVTSWEVTEDNEGDWIVFSIDQIAPVTLIYDDQGDEVDFSLYYSSLDLEFECAEPNFFVDGFSNTWGMTFGNVWDGSFGCEELILYF